MLDRLRERRYDLVVSDMRMPHVAGEELLAARTSTPSWASA
jgi:CheY-like chemotaxis protein